MQTQRWARDFQDNQHAKFLCSRDILLHRRHHAACRSTSGLSIRMAPGTSGCQLLYRPCLCLTGPTGIQLARRGTPSKACYSTD